MGWLQRLLRGGDGSDGLLPIRLLLTRWRHLLWTEQELLAVLGDLSQKLWGEFVLDRQFAQSCVERAFQLALRLAYDGGILCGYAAGDDYGCLDELRRAATDYLGSWPVGHRGAMVLPLDNSVPLRVVEVGQQARDLGLVLARGVAPVARGFIITCQALVAILIENGLAHHLQPPAPASRVGWEAAYAALAGALPRSSIPTALEQAVQEAFGSLGVGAGGEWAVWPSPMRSEALPAVPCLRAFAGPAGLWSEALRVAADYFALPELAQLSARSRCPLLTALVVQHRVARGPVFVVRTLDPVHPDAAALLWRTAGQESWQPIPRGGDWPDVEQADLARRSLAVERLTHRAAEVAWQRDHKGELILVQTRRLDAEARRAPAISEDGLAPEPVWFQGDGHICRGVACGPAVRVADAAAAAAFPEGAVLVAPRWTAGYEAALPRAAALLLGPPPPYPVIARIRSLGIPTIIGLARAIEIPDGTVVTVDAEEERVYRGRLDALCVAHLLSGSLLEDEPEYLVLEGILDLLGRPEGASLADAPLAPSGDATLLDAVTRIHLRVQSHLVDASLAHQAGWPRTSLHLGGRFHLPVTLVQLEGAPARGAIDAHEIESAPWAVFLEGLISEIELPPSAELPPAAGCPLIVTTKRSLHLASAGPGLRCLLSARLTGVSELNHLHWWCEASEELRCFGRPDSETEERLRDVGRRWGPRALGLEGAS